MVPASSFTTIAIDLHVCKRGESLALFSVVVVVVVSRFCSLILLFLFRTLFVFFLAFMTNSFAFAIRRVRESER